MEQHSAIIIIPSFCSSQNTAHSRCSSIWFYVRIDLFSLSNLLQCQLHCPFPGRSWSTPLPYTLRLPVQSVSFYCTMLFKKCVNQPNAIFFYLLFSKCLFCCHNSFETLSGHLTFKICRRHRFTHTWNE
jgi:hypothetical protein